MKPQILPSICVALSDSHVIRYFFSLSVPVHVQYILPVTPDTREMNAREKKPTSAIPLLQSEVSRCLLPVKYTK